ncbi:hypothetical protein CALVIDRAFT_51875 [Calocera viscosa TUFC12733]|uniref:Uncharacterized protein n=1 Tax=Calocera viscosa (strain TUFC12733) TaxID=1330018 RepID=A0A167NT04_CALVF|nr:hypothetical protein CALVIDRAFT_51875 [Calocera viscosa TUFC12733]
MSSFPLPELPPYLTLLLTGILSPPCPLHLALAHLASQPGATHGRSRVLIVTARSQDTFERKLRAYDDAWLNENSLKGRWAPLLACIEIFYSKTPVELRQVLSLLRPSSLLNSQLPGAPSKAVLDVIPSLVILHDLSAWFIGEMRKPSHALSNYLELVSMGLDFARYLNQLQEGAEPTRLALIDGKLCDLCLPVVGQTPEKADATKTASDDAPHDVEQMKQKLEPLLPVISKYFDWVGCVEKCSVPSPSAAEEDYPSHPQLSMRRLKLHRSTSLSGLSTKLPEEHTFQWKEDRPLLGEFSELKATTITHLDGEEGKPCC